MNVYVVGIVHAEGRSIKSVHQSLDGAQRAWQELRRELLADAEQSLNDAPEMAKLYQHMIDALRETNPDKMNNYPSEQPYLKEMELLP